MSSAPPCMAIVHEWISARAGSEQVFEAIAKMYPQADLFALSRDPSVEMDFAGRELGTTVLDRRPFRDRRGLTLPLMPLAWWQLGRRDYDIVISSHHAFAASNRLTRYGHHLAYVYSPARYVWTPELDERGAHPLLRPARRLLKNVDLHAARRLSSVAAISHEVANRVREFWGRDARVIYPAVDTEYFQTKPALIDYPETPDGYLLGLGRWIPYKNHLLTIDIGERLGRPVVIAGSGPLADVLQERARTASVPVLIIERPSRAEVRALYHRASVFLFPTREDFGIVPVEAMASGTPVVAYGHGGAAETVVPGLSGMLVDRHDVDDYAAAVRRADSIDPTECVARSEEFSHARFVAEFSGWVAETLQRPVGGEWSRGRATDR